MYVDGFLIPIPKKNIATYRKIAKLAGKVWKEYGALEYVECVADEFESKHDGKVMKSIFPARRPARRSFSRGSPTSRRRTASAS